MNFTKIIEMQREWSERVVGPGRRTEALLAHLWKEIKEIEADPSDLTEWVDVIIIAMDGAWRAGYSPGQILEALLRKQAVNRARTWPDWRTHPEGVPFEHVRTGEETP